MFKRLSNDTVEFNGNVLTIIKRPGGRATHTYEVTLSKGVWPSQSELISLCDGNDGNIRSDFGGSVSITGTSAVVQVYVD